MEKIEIVSPPVYPVVSQESPQKPSKRPLIIGGVIAVVVVIAMVIAGALCGVYLQNKQVVELAKEYKLSMKDASGKKIEEKVKVDVKNNQEQYTMDNGKLKVLDDFNKGITVMRTSINGKYACYVKPFNKTGVAEPAALKNYLDTHKSNSKDDKVEDDDEPKQAYVAAQDAISDTSFLGARIQDMCKGVKTYWLLPANENKVRSKRGLCRRYRCYVRYYYVFGRWYYKYYCYYVLQFCFG